MAELKKMPIPLDEKLGHLNASEVKKLFDAYHFKKQKAKDIINDYKLVDVPLTGLRYILNYKENPENSCPIHNTISWQKAKGRNKWGIPFCPECKIELWIELQLNYFKPNKPVFITQRYKTEHQKIIINSLGKEQYLKLSFPLKVFLLSWFNEGNRSTTAILELHKLNSLKMCPTNLMKEDFILELQKEQLYIGNQYLLQQIHINEDLFMYFEQSNYLLNGSAEDHFNLWWDIAYQEISEYYLYEMVKKNFVPQLEPRVIDVLQYLIKNLPVQQCMFVLWAALKDACGLVAENNWNVEYTAQIIPEQIKKKADRVIDGSLKRFAFNRPPRCKQSIISKFFFEHVTNLEYNGFTECPTIDIFIRRK